MGHLAHPRKADQIFKTVIKYFTIVQYIKTIKYFKTIIKYLETIVEYLESIKYFKTIIQYLKTNILQLSNISRPIGSKLLEIMRHIVNVNASALVSNSTFSKVVIFRLLLQRSPKQLEIKKIESFESQLIDFLERCHTLSIPSSIFLNFDINIVFGPRSDELIKKTIGAKVQAPCQFI